jgi:uroporphyrinogen decarboxylase
MSNVLFQNAIQRIAQKTPPIWMMRQAGRYHKHYQGLRAKHSFMELCKNPELAAEVAFGPVNEFDFDVSILFSDILFPLEALGMGLEYTDSGPKLGLNLTPETIKNLKSPEQAIEGLLFQKEAMKLTRERIPSHKSVIGFIGGPWTLFTYAVSGRHDGSLIHAKQNRQLQSDFFAILLPLLKQNIQLQIEGGAEVVMVFDTAAGELALNEFSRVAENLVSELSAAFPRKLAYYSKGTSEAATKKMMENVNLVGVGVDHRLPLLSILKENRIGFTQGNFDQALLFRDGNDFAKSLEEYLQPYRDIPAEERIGWVAGLGHGVLPKTPESNVKHYVDTIRRVFA